MRNITRENHEKLKKDLEEYNELLRKKPIGLQTNRDKLIISLNEIKGKLKENNNLYFQFKDIGNMSKEDKFIKGKSIAMQRQYFTALNELKSESFKETGQTVQYKLNLLSLLLKQPHTSVTAKWNRSKNKFSLAIKDTISDKIIHISHIKYEHVLEISKDLDIVIPIFSELHDQAKNKTISYAKRYIKKYNTETRENIQKELQLARKIIKDLEQDLNPLLNNLTTIESAIIQLSKNVDVLNRLYLTLENPDTKEKIDSVEEEIIKTFNNSGAHPKIGLSIIDSPEEEIVYIFFEYMKLTLMVVPLPPSRTVGFVSQLKGFNTHSIIETVENKQLRDIYYSQLFEIQNKQEVD